VKYLYGHATLVTADLLEDGVEASVELSPVFELGVRTGIVGLSPHLLALSQHLTTTAPLRSNYNNDNNNNNNNN